MESLDGVRKHLKLAPLLELTVTTLPKSIIILGPPGSGKDTQAFALAKNFGYFVLVTGDLFRAEITHGASVGKEMQAMMNRGELLPAEMVKTVMEDELMRHKSTIAAVGLVFDGFPRREEEIQDAEELIDRYELRPSAVVLLEVADDNLITRLASRGRPDDKPEVARHRIEVYKKQTAPIIEYYKSKDMLITIDGNGPVGAVTSDMLAKVKSF